MSKTWPACTDHSWGRPGAQAIKDAGYDGVMRYLGDPKNGKNIGKEEMDSYHNVGLWVGFVWETDDNRVLSGFPGGAEDGPKANYWADQLGVPSDYPIIGTCVDFDANSAQLKGPIADYATGFTRNSKRPQLPYGSDRALNVLCGELRMFRCGWQTVAWSGGRVSPYACMVQQVGYVLNQTSDHNSIIMLDEVNKLGWNPHDATPAPKEEDDMYPQCIWWSKPNDPWVKDVALPFLLEHGEDPALMLADHEHGFWIDGPFARYIGIHAWEQHSGWDRRTEDARLYLRLLAFMSGKPFNDGDGEAHGIEWPAWKRHTLLPDSLPAHPAVNFEVGSVTVPPISEKDAMLIAKTTVAETGRLYQ